MKLKLTVYWLTTALVCALELFSAGFTFAKPDEAAKGTAHLQYPPYFPKMLAVAAILGSLTLLSPRLPRLKEWAYAGFTFLFISAAYSHYMANEPEKAPMAIVALAVLMISYFTRPVSRRIR